jgi:hypothetical protein
MRIHETPKGRIVAACDKELLGKVVDDGKATLDLKTHKEFYGGGPADRARLKEELKSFTSANLVGEKAVNTALELELVEKDAIIYINKIPHIQLYRI